MNEKKITPLEDPSEVPEDMTEEEERKFWDTHGVTEEFLEKTEPVPEDELPPVRPRTRPISLRFDDDTLKRLKLLAEKKHKGYQTLLKEFVAERLYEEEKREGIISAR